MSPPNKHDRQVERDRNSGPEAPGSRLRAAPEGPLDAAQPSEIAALAPSSHVGGGMRSGAAAAPPPWEPERRASQHPGDAGEASETAARPSRDGAPAPVARFDVGPAATHAPTPSRANLRSSANPENGAEASESASARFASTATPSPAPPEFAGAAAAGTPAKLGPIASSSPAAQAWGARHVKASEDRRGQAAAPSAPSVPPPVGAHGSPAPADAGAPSDRKRGPHAGVSDGADGRKPEGAAPETHASGAALPALLPPAGRLSGRLAALAETAKAYARAAQADNTQRAYAADWKMFASWLRRQGLAETPPDPEAVGLYLAASSRARRRGAFGRDPRAAAVGDRLALPPARRAARHPRPAYRHRARRHPRAGTAALPCRRPRSSPTSFWRCWRRWTMDLRGLRDRAILAIGFAGGLRRSEIVGLDCGPDQTEDGSGWIEIFPEGALLTIRGKTGWREVEIGRGSRPDTCPVALLETWMRLGRIARGPAVPRRSRARTAAFRIRAADRQARRPAGEDMRPRRRPARRPDRGRAAGSPSAAIRCAPASPPPPRSRRPTSRSTSATPAPK